MICPFVVFCICWHLDSYKQYEPAYQDNHTVLLRVFCESSATDWAQIFYNHFFESMYMTLSFWKSVASLKNKPVVEMQYIYKKKCTEKSITNSQVNKNKITEIRLINCRYVNQKWKAAI